MSAPPTDLGTRRSPAQATGRRTTTAASITTTLLHGPEPLAFFAICRCPIGAAPYRSFDHSERWPKVASRNMFDRLRSWWRLAVPDAKTKTSESEQALTQGAEEFRQRLLRAILNPSGGHFNSTNSQAAVDATIREVVWLVESLPAIERRKRTRP